MAAERLQKLLARAGFGSRRACEELITAGRVTVDGQVVKELGAKADLATRDVRLDGSRLRAEHPEYWLLNKPAGVVCTNFDPAGRRRPIDLMSHVKARLFPVGRLDVDSKGLLIMTNDGEFANRLAHPRYEVPKTYLATVAGEVTPGDVRRIMRGVYLSEGRTRTSQIRVIKRSRMRSIVEVTIREGRNRQVRRMLARLGHPVQDLVRTRIGRISLRGLGAGQSRRLMPDELEYLREMPETPPPVRQPFKRPEVAPPAAEQGVAHAGLRHGGAGLRPGGAGQPAPAQAEQRPSVPGAVRLPRREHRPPEKGERRPPWQRGKRPPERREFRPRGDRARPPFEKRGARGPERREFRPRGDRARPPLEKRGRPPFEKRRERGPERGGPPRGGPPRGGPHRGDRREGPREKPKRFQEKRSRSQHDTDGVGKKGPGDRRDARGGRGRGPGDRDGPPQRGRRVRGHPPQ